MRWPTASMTEREGSTKLTFKNASLKIGLTKLENQEGNLVRGLCG